MWMENKGKTITTSKWTRSRHIVYLSISLFVLSLIPSEVVSQEVFQWVAPIQPWLNEPLYGLRIPHTRGILFFGYSDEASGWEIWKSDGTTDGTGLLMDIYPGWRSSAPTNYYPFQGLMYFVAGDSSHGRELWRSNGTASGTRLVADLNPGPEGLIFKEFIDCNGRLYFICEYGMPQLSYLYTTDGANDIRRLLGSSDKDPTHFSGPVSCFDKKLYFVASDSSHGRELWVTDGTVEGTKLFHDFAQGPQNSDVYELEPVDRKLYIAVNSDWFREHHLWVYDGSSGEPTPLARFASTGSPSLTQLTRAGSSLFFQVNSQTGHDQLWKTNGREEGTVRVKEFKSRNPHYTINQLIDTEGLLFFVADDSLHGTELWRSDGTEEGTVLVKDIAPGFEGKGDARGSRPSLLTPVFGQLYFVASDGVGPGVLWRTDGTSYGTVAVPDFPATGISPLFLTNVDGTLYFTVTETDGNTRALWKMTQPRSSSVIRGGFSLHQNYPNPFNGGTRIHYSILRSAHVRLSVYDLLGAETSRLVDGVQFAGDYSVDFSGSGYPTGFYFYTISVDGRQQIGKMVLVK